MSGGKSKSVTVGYRYYMGIHFAICYGPVDALKEIRVGERIAWTGSAEASVTISIDAEDLFGGEGREGGVSGTAAVMMGAKTQEPNGYLQSVITGLMPAFRGVLGLVLNKGYIGANNPYIKPWAFLVRRIFAGWDDDESGGSEVVRSGHAVYDWEENTTRPDRCENDHAYRFVPESAGGYVSPYRATVEEAIADAEVYLEIGRAHV